jgi:hypothetical protein
MLSVTVGGSLSSLPPRVAALGARYDPNRRTVRVDGLAPADVALVLTDLESVGCTIDHVEFGRASLQDVFLELVGH